MESKQTLRVRFTAAMLIPLLAFSLLSPALLSSARAIGPTPGEIELPEDATPEQVLDRLCEELKRHPEQSIDMANWAVAYFQQQIRLTPAFASALGIVFADCLAQSGVSDGKQLAPVGAGPTDPLAERIANTLIALYIAMNYLPPGSTAARDMVIAAIAVLDPALAAQVIELFGKAIGSGISESDFFGDSTPPAGGFDNVIEQIEQLILEAKTPTPTPTATPSASPSPTMTPLPTATPPVTPVLNT